MLELLEQVKTELINAAGEVSDRAKDVSNIISLQRELKKKEAFAEALYIEFGQKYYEEHKDDQNEDFTDLRATLQRIEELKEEITDIKGTQTCGNCGAKIPEGAAFCSKCGAKIGEDVQIFEEDDIEVE